MFEPFSLAAPAKINLALHVLGRRTDGYHELDSIVAFASVGDRLTFTPASAFDVTAEGPFAAELPQRPAKSSSSRPTAARAGSPAGAARACRPSQFTW